MIALMLAALVQGSAPVTSMTASNLPPAKSVQADKDGLVCHKEAVLGSRMKTKVCLTPAAARQRAQDDRDLVEKAQVLQTIRDPAAGPPP